MNEANPNTDSVSQLDRNRPMKIVLCLDGPDIYKIGDMIIRISQLKLLKYYFNNAQIVVNSPATLFPELAKHSEFVGEVTNLQPEAIDFNRYDLVLLHVNRISRYTRAIATYTKDKPANFKLFRLTEPFDFEERISAPPLLEKFLAFDAYPMDLIEDVNRREITLSKDELMEGVGILDQYVTNEKLILFIYSASTYTKIFKMSVVIELMKYFQSLPNRKLVLFDPGDDKTAFLQAMKVDVDNIVILKKLTVRQTFSVMADERVELILGPCTGLLHGASGIYNSLIKRKVRNSTPTMVVYTGLYEKEGIQSAYTWWYGSLVKCLILKSDESGGQHICKLEDFDQSDLLLQNAILPCRNYTSEIVRDFLYRNYKIGLPISEI